MQKTCNELQTRILNIFKIVKEIIDKHELRYFAIGGTAIGAVRHGGFIPWDDDLDIALPREDYNKLLEILQTELPDNLELRTAGFSEFYFLKFSKVLDKNTTIIENQYSDIPELDEGVYIDIMPVDGLPSNSFFRKRHIKKLSIINKLDFYSSIEPNANSNSNLLKIWKIIRTCKFLFNTKRLRKKYYKIATKYSLYKTKYMGFKWFYPGHKQILLDSSYIFDLIEFKFEDTTIKLLKNYDEYLTQHFGEYMKLPPMDKQVSHHGFIVIDYTTPYKKYREMKR